ncbi:FAD/NAD(P)-binding domain-containing protein, partial [Periconia macrospinosa]
VSGAGVAGSSLALMLARHPKLTPKPIVTLIERSPVPRTTGQAIDIRGPGVHVIRNFGLEEKIRAKHTTEKGIAILGRHGKEVAHFEASGSADKQSFATSEFEVLRGELVKVLMDEIEDSKTESGVNVETIYGEMIHSVEEEADGVMVNFTNGKIDDQKYDLVIAADGMGSRTRSLMFPDKAYQSTECTSFLGWYIGYCTVPRQEDDSDYWRWYNGPGGLCLHVRPHRGQKTVGVYFSIVNAEKRRYPEYENVLSKGVEAQKALIRDRFKHMGWKTLHYLDGMDDADDFYMQQTAQVRTPKWTKGRCAIIGDAAHCTMGIGTSLAFMDAYMISGELTKMKSNDGEEIAAALNRYEETLRPYYESNSTMPWGFPQLANPQTQFGISISHIIVRIVSWLRLDKLMMAAFDQEEKEWKLPEYGW